MGKEIESLFGASITADFEIGILIESQMVRFTGAWSIQELPQEVIPDLRDLSSLDYIITIRKRNHLVHPDDVAILLDAVNHVGESGDFEVSLRVIQAEGRIRKLHAIGKLRFSQRSVLTPERTGWSSLDFGLCTLMLWVPATPTPARSKDRSPLDGNSTPILFYIDTNVKLRDEMIKVLGAIGTAAVLDTVDDAVKLLRDGSVPELILINVSAVGPEGIAQLAMIRAGEKWTHIPQVLFSDGMATLSDLSGFDAPFVAKPVCVRELVNMLQNTLRPFHASAQDSLRQANIQLEADVKEGTLRLLQSRDELQTQKELLQRLLDAMPQLVWTADSLGTTCKFNERWYEYTGLSDTGEGVTYVNSGVVHPSQLREVQNKWQFSLNEGISYSNETLVRDRNGDFRWHLDLATPIKNERGEIFMWIGTLTDVHEQFLAEKRVEENRNLLKTILDSSPNGIAQLECCRDEVHSRIVDFEWKYYNGNIESIFSPDLMNRKLTETNPDTLKDGFFNKLKKTMIKGESLQFVYKMKKEEGQVWYQMTSTKLEDNVVITLYNITNHVKTADELKQLNGSLEQKNSDLQNMNEQLSTFAFVASHDLREPLRKIQFFVNGIIASDKHVLSDKGKLYFNKILASANRMDALINDVLRFSRANAPEAMEEVDMNKVLADAISDVSEIIREKNAIIRSETLPVVRGNQLQLTQLLGNLISNALKFQQVGTPPIVSVTGRIVSGAAVGNAHADRKKDYAQITVADNGIGFDEQYLPKIFQMFQRLHGISEYPGTGMGLAICKRIVENHNGFIVAKSNEGEGAAFTCYLPL